MLPDLACYAGMPPERAVPVIEAHLAGSADVSWLRGVAGLHPAQQVALGAVLEHWGPAGTAGLETRLVGEEGTFDAGTWAVQVSGHGSTPAVARVVVVSSRRAEAARLTCRADHDTRALQWDVVSIEIAGDRA